MPPRGASAMRCVRASVTTSRSSSPIASAGRGGGASSTSRSVWRGGRRPRGFPRPFTVISGGRIWHIAGVQLWIAGHRPKVAPAAAGPFGQEAATLLRSAEALALEYQHGHVGSNHVWLVLARAE